MSRTAHMLLALAVYAACGWLIMLHGASLTQALSGIGSDPYDSTWFLAWWPYALTHHLDPFFTRLIWYPYGVSTLWVTAVPLLSLVTWPITALAGPVLSYNLLIISAPVFGAFCGFLLCRHYTRDFAACLAGGFIFGFSAYETAQSLGALNLSIIAFIPLLLLLVQKRLDNEISRPALVAGAALLLLTQFLVCIEIFAMIFVFGGISWALAMLYLEAQRGVLRRLFFDALWTAPFVALPCAPLLLSMARHAALIAHPYGWAYVFTVDLCALIIPSPHNLFGAPFASLSRHFVFVPQEAGGYLGLPLIVLLLWFIRNEGKTPRGRYLAACLLACLILSFGPLLMVDGQFTRLVLPWAGLMRLPLLGAALPGRFALFTSLACGLIVALFMAHPQGRRWRMLLGVLACLALWPKPHPFAPVPVSAFFAQGRVQAVLGPNPRLLILPFSRHGASSFWQQENGFGFTEVGGYLGYPPAPAQSYKAVMELFSGKFGPGFAGDLAAYAQAAGVQYVVAGPGTGADVLGRMATLHWPVRQLDDVRIFTVPVAR